MSLDIKFSGKDQYPKHLRMLLAGDRGVGKTSLAATAPNPLWAACAPGIATLSLLEVPFVDISRESDLLELKNLLARDSEHVEGAIGAPVDTLVVDCVDELQRLLFIERLKKERRTEISRDDWNWIAQRLHAIFGGLNSLDLNIIYITHLKEGVGDELHYQPNIQGGFVDQIHTYVDVSAVLTSEGLLGSRVEDDKIEAEVDLDFDSSSRFLLTERTKLYPWANDQTQAIPTTLVELDNDISHMIDSLSSFRESLSESKSSIEISDQLEEAEETEEESAPEIEVPGMSTDESIAEILSLSKLPGDHKDPKPQNKEQEKLIYGTNP